MKILLVEDNAALRRNVARALQLAGYQVVECADGDEGCFHLLAGGCDVAVLDRMLPGEDGLTILQAARRRGIATPVLILSAMNRVGDKVDGLNAGADDYLPKPFEMEELLARVAALARRPAALETRDEARFADLRYQPVPPTLVGPAGAARLSPREGALIELFLRANGQVLTRATIFNRVWGPDAPVEDGNISTYVHFLRRRLREVGSAARFASVRGVGFALRGGEDEI